MLISVIVPIYNAVNSIMNCAKHLLAALPENGEIIMVDDGSKDGSAEMCDQLATTDGRIVVVHQLNSGAGVARNTGIERARGEYILFCDVDDWVEDSIISVMVNKACQKSAQIVICGNYVHRQNIKDSVQRYEEEFLDKADEVRKKYFFIGKAPWCKLYRRDILIGSNIRFPAQRRVQDAIFNLEYFDHISNCYVIKEVLYHYNANTGVTLAKKFKSDVFGMYLNAVRLMYKKVEKWGIQDAAVENRIGMFLLLAVDKYITAIAYSNLSRDEKKTNVQQMLEDEMVKKTLPRFRSKSIYYKLLKSIMETGSAAFTYSFVKAKVKIARIVK